jgi:hypothetical protein
MLELEEALSNLHGFTDVIPGTIVAAIVIVFIFTTFAAYKREHGHRNWK